MDHHGRREAGRRPGPHTTRTIPQVIWEKYRSELESLKLKKGYTLTQIMGLMEEKHQFKATATQYKKQFSKWEFRCNFSLSDAALMAYHFRLAEQQGRKCRIKFNNREKTRKHIERYINKSKKVKSEDELLTKLPKNTKLPAHISFEYVSNPPAPFYLEALDSSLLPVGPNSSATWSDISPGGVSQNESLLMTPLSCLSRKTSSSSIEMIDLPPPDSDFVDDSEDNSDEDEENIDARYRARLNNCCIDQRLSPAMDGVVRQLLSPTPVAHMDNANLLGLMSVTPTSMMQYPGTTRESAEILNFPPIEPCAMLNASQENHSNVFLTASFCACIWRGQAEDPRADHQFLKRMATEELTRASLSLRNMVLEVDGELLSTLSMLLAVLDAHGQSDFAEERLEDAFNIAQEILGCTHAVTNSIKHMLFVSRKSCDQSSEFGSEILREIQSRIAEYFGPESKSALVASYQVGWALLRERRHIEAEKVLRDLRWLCEKVFGPLQMHTVMSGLTLARAFYHQGRVSSAEILVDEMIGRLEKVFAKYHPYRLEARARQARFLTDLNRPADAEDLLREVVQQRFAVLGPTNPRSQQSFKTLRKLLIQQNKTRDADELWNVMLAQGTNPDFLKDPWKAYVNVRNIKYQA